MKIKRNIAMSLIKDLIQDEKFKKEMIDLTIVVPVELVQHK